MSSNTIKTLRRVRFGGRGYLELMGYNYPSLEATTRENPHAHLIPEHAVLLASGGCGIIANLASIQKDIAKSFGTETKLFSNLEGDFSIIFSVPIKEEIRDPRKFLRSIRAKMAIMMSAADEDHKISFMRIQDEDVLGAPRDPPLRKE